jgi:hypothetical protein
VRRILRRLYGNSRPIFTGGRVFALIGTEMVEGRVDDGRIREIRRLDITTKPGDRRSLRRRNKRPAIR